jgi:hypothetical protein
MIDGLAGAKNSAGTVVFVCSKCRTYSSHAYGAPNRDQLVYMLVCPKCGRTLGEWISVEDRERELLEFAGRVELLTQAGAIQIPPHPRHTLNSFRRGFP